MEKTGRRENLRTVRIFSPSLLDKHLTKEQPFFQMAGGAVCGLDPAGNIVRVNKDSRSVKERKRERRERRGA
jgi:hypothetical protein